MPIRVQLSRRPGWRMPPNTIKVSRPAAWGNPYIIGVHGTRARCVELFEHLMRGHVCITCGIEPGVQERYLRHAKDRIHSLKGKNLACWCSLNGPCHADVLMEIANR